MHHTKNQHKIITYQANLDSKNNIINNNQCFLGAKYSILQERNAKFMNNIALSFGKRKITYEEMHERIIQYAKALYSRGIRKGDKISVCLENNPESVYLIYALDIIGAKRIGLSIFNNHYKMKRDIEQIKPKMVISTTTSFEYLKNPCSALNISPILYNPDDFDDDLSEHQTLKSFLKVKDEQAVFPNIENSVATDILFTGGSSGIHKGVELNGFSINEVAKSTAEIFSLSPGMIHLGNIPFGHMIFGLFVLQYCLSNNLEFALTLKSLPNDFLEEILRIKPNGAMGGPVHFENFHNNTLLTKGSLTFLHQVATGGEMLKNKTYSQTMDALRYGGSDATLINMLGLTEMSGLTHCCIPDKNKLGTLGDPISCVTDIIVDPKTLQKTENGRQKELREVPQGQTGVLLTTGKSMLLRYYENSNETNKVFVYDDLGNKWYNTGDLAYRTGNTEKEINFSGRLKRNFVSGYDNIYPEQVEQLLTTIDIISEAVVTKIADDVYQFLPVYHICLKNDEYDIVLLEEQINELITNTLGINALPGYIKYYIKPLRRTDNGKLDSVLLEKEFIREYNDAKFYYEKKR